MMASEAARPALAPGVTWTGTGDQNSVSSGFTPGLLEPPCASAKDGNSSKARNIARIVASVFTRS